MGSDLCLFLQISSREAKSKRMPLYCRPGVKRTPSPNCTKRPIMEKPREKKKIAVYNFALISFTKAVASLLTTTSPDL